MKIVESLIGEIKKTKFFFLSIIYMTADQKNKDIICSDIRYNRYMTEAMVQKCEGDISKLCDCYICKLKSEITNNLENEIIEEWRNEITHSAAH